MNNPLSQAAELLRVSNPILALQLTALASEHKDHKCIKCNGPAQRTNFVVINTTSAALEIKITYNEAAERCIKHTADLLRTVLATQPIMEISPS